MKNDLLAEAGYIRKVESIGDPLQKMEAVVDFSALAQAVERIAPGPEQPKGGRPPYPTEVMVRVLVVNACMAYPTNRPSSSCWTVAASGDSVVWSTPSIFPIGPRSGVLKTGSG